MTRAFHRQFQEGGSKVKNVCAEPPQTDRGSNLAWGHAQHGSDVSASQAAMLSRRHLMLACSATDVASKDLFMPGGRFQKTVCGRAVQVIPADRPTHAQKWTAETCEHEKFTLDPAKHELFWSTSVKAVGAINGPLHFTADDQARTSVEQNANEGAPMAWYAEPGAGVKWNDPCKHRPPHGVVIEGTAPDAHSSGDCCSFIFFLARNTTPTDVAPVSSHSSVFATVLRSTRRHICHSQGICVVSRRHSPCHPPELSSIMVVEQDGCKKTVAETAAPMARRSVGKVSDEGPVRIMDGTTTEKIAEWNRRKMEASAS